MQIIDKIYIDGAFVTPHGEDEYRVDMITPSLVFSDGHARGIYPWSWLQGLGYFSCPSQ